MNRLRYLSYCVILIVCVFMFSGFIYAYKEYKIGDEIEYNGIKFYVIKNSNSKEDSLTMLKAEPLTVDEVNKYGGVGTDDNHVNKYTYESVGMARDLNGYGGMAYYASETCKNGEYDGCIIEYSQSDIKYVIDAWAKDKVSNGLQDVRLIKYGELIDELGFKLKNSGTGYEPSLTKTPSWLYDVDYHYWTMSLYDDRYVYRWTLGGDYCGGNNAGLCAVPTYENNYLVRPVVTISKSAIEEDVLINDNDEAELIDATNDNNSNVIDNKKDNKKVSVNVPDTLKKISALLIMLGVTLVSISIVIVIKNRK